jgi:RNA polymerase sigma-70 factor, ECF subfamily
MSAIQADLYQKIKRYVTHKIRNKEDVQDIVQNVFVKVQLHEGELRESEKIIGWIYRITRNSITDYYRLRKKEQAGVWIEPQEDRHFFNECVEQCLSVLSNELPEPYKEALLLSEQEAISQIELAKRWGISYSGAKSRVQRARLLLKEKMETLYRIKTDAYGNVIVCENRGPCGCNSYEVLQESNKQY